jgi:hypothetical protein
MIFGKKVTTEDAIKMATSHLANDITGLSSRKDSALSTFRRTATELSSINDALKTKLCNLDELSSFIQEQQNAANQMIHDNDAVRSRILEIIGE